MAAKKTGHGGARPGTGPKPLPRSQVRRNRVVAMVLDSEYRALQQLAKRRGLGVGTTAYELLSDALRAESARDRRKQRGPG